MYKQIQLGKIVNFLCKLYVYKESCLEIPIFLNCPLYLTYLLYFQLFSTVDLLSYIGGVLGLCLGFSAMSALECIYFFTLRLGLNIRMKRSEHDVWLLNSWKLFQFVWNNKGFIIYIIATKYLIGVLCDHHFQVVSAIANQNKVFWAEVPEIYPLILTWKSTSMPRTSNLQITLCRKARPTAIPTFYLFFNQS